MQARQPRNDRLDGGHSFVIAGKISQRRVALPRFAAMQGWSLPRAWKRQLVGGWLRLRLGQEPAQICQRRPQMMAMNDHVDHAMVLEIFRPLKAVGQFLANGLLDDPRPGKTYERARFRDVDVA